MTKPEPAAQQGGNIEADLQRIEVGIRQLKVQYDMFFAGSRKTQPLEMRTQVERIIKRYLNAPIRKYANRFHFNALVSRFNSMSELWGKTIRSMEEGDRRPHGVQEKFHFRERLVARCRISDPRQDDQTMQGLYKRFREAHRRVGRAEGSVTYDKFVRGISAQTRNLQKSSGCGEIELRLIICDDKVQLKARPGK